MEIQDSKDNGKITDDIIPLFNSPRTCLNPATKAETETGSIFELVRLREKFLMYFPKKKPDHNKLENQIEE